MRRLPFAILLVLFAGCATPPLSVVEVGTIRNEAILEYSYGEAKPFRLRSPPADIVALVPYAFGTEAAAAAQQDASDAAAQMTSVHAQSSAEGQHAAATLAADANKSTLDAQDARSELRRIDAAATRQETDVASSVAHSTASERHRITDSCAWQEDRSGSATVREQTAASSEESLTQASSIGSADYTGSTHAEAHAAHAMQRVASARTDTNDASAISTWTTTLPVIRKWATRSRVVVGERFDYVVEVRNDSALDLAFAAVLDTLDDRLLINASDVHATPSAKLDVDLTDQRLRVEFTGGIKRGRTIRIIIPAVLKTKIADRDRDAPCGAPLPHH